MNISCWNCGGIRPFSGEPLACDVCGWVLGTSTVPPTSANYTKSPAQIAHDDRIRGYKVLIVAVGIIILIGVTASIWETGENDKVTQQFLSSHPDCHYPANRLLGYLATYNKGVDWANLATACSDLRNGTHSFQLPSTSTPQSPESVEHIYQPILIISSAIEHGADDFCVATFDWENTRYTVERQKHIWLSDCEVFQKDKMYFARWTSDKHDEFSIGSLKPQHFVQDQVMEHDLENVLTYSVRHWSNSRF